MDTAKGQDNGGAISIAAGDLLVVDPESTQPIGVLSSLDIIGNLAWARG
jgi:hypothetical protein